MSSTPDDYTTAAAPTTRPWADFFDTASISLPVSLSDATSRLNRNLAYFKLNYGNLALTVFFISLFFRPLSLLVLFLTAAAWYFLFFFRRDGDLEIAGFTIDDRIIGAVMGVITVLALAYANVWMNLIVSIAISAVIVCLHGVLRVPTSGDDNPYGGLLDAEAGGYSEF